MRRSLKEGFLPQADTVRVEEMVNYFPYDWKGPDAASTPFNSTVIVMPTPWNEHTKLMHVAIKGYDITPAEQPKANLVFLLDVSGSMNEPDKLPLLQSAFRLLVSKLNPDDTVSIVTYAGDAGTVLMPTKVSERAKILSAIDNLTPGGSTAGEAGIKEAYKLAEQSFVQGGVNRVMLATDGDFNVGQTDDEDLKRIIEEKRKSGVFLSVFGFGRGNLNDQMMQTIAQNGNGTAAYIDTLAEAEKVLVQDASSTLFPIAKDVKIQVEFNPAAVSEYRLIGYETRALNREDFNNDRVDAGEIGSGHSVTAIYEITPKGAPSRSTICATARPRPNNGGVANADEYAFVKIRYKLPDGGRLEADHHAGDEGQRSRRPSMRRAPTSASRSRSRPSARSCAVPIRRPRSATTGSWRLPLPRGERTRMATGPSSSRWCALPRRSTAATGSGDDGRVLSGWVVLNTGTRPSEAGRRRAISAGLFHLAGVKIFQTDLAKDISLNRYDA